MRCLKATLILICLIGLPSLGLAAEAQATHAAVAGQPAAEHAHEGIPSSAETLWNIGPLPVTNSMLVTWIVAVGLIVFAQVATRRIQEVPTGIQNFWEWLVEGLYSFLEDIIGHD